MANISVDGGKTFCTVNDLIEFLTFEDDIDFDTLGYCMDKNDTYAFEKVMMEWETTDFTLNQLIARYLELAKSDLIIE